MLRIIAGALGALALAALAAPTARAVETIDPAAVALLKRMDQTLAGAKTLAFTATALHDVRNAEGQSIYLVEAARVRLWRPDRLRITVLGDGPGIDAVWDGKVLRAYNPVTRSVATLSETSLAGVMKAAAQRAGLAVPFADVVLAGTVKPITEGLTSAHVVGRSRIIGGVPTDVVSFAAPDAHGQVWIGRRDGLPRKLVVTWVDEPGRPTHSVDFSRWRLDKPLRNRAFDATHMEGAREVPLDALKP